MTGSSVNRYGLRNTETMELVYGKGYMSAGGDAEVAGIVANITIRNQHILDIGCGLGGAAISLVRDHHAHQVDGLDIDSNVIRRAGELIEAADIGDRVTLTRFDGGALPYPSDNFDVVYLTATSCHLKNLYSFFLRSAGYCAVGAGWSAASGSRLQTIPLTEIGALF